MDRPQEPTPEEPLARLRAASAALAAGGDDAADPAGEADRFEALHEALVAVLDDVDRG